MTDDVVITKEMGITHQEFFRNIPRIFDTDQFSVNTDGVALVEAAKSLNITISEQGERRIALFALPVTHVTLTFSGYDEAAVTKTMAAFDLAFQRGGG
jgi:hypothetical protein